MLYNEKISIIIPVYNVQEKYFRECIHSVINQTYDNLEIILVDDGSTNGIELICEEYKKKDNRIKVFHRKNSGVSASRNFGIEIATGNYIGFIDADDYIEKNMYKLLYENICKYNKDIAACGYKVKYTNNTVINLYNTEKIYNMDKIQTIQSFLDENSFGVGVWNKLFKAGLAKKVKFEKKYKINEDRLYLIETILNSNGMVYEDRCKYNYIKRENSTTTSKITKSFLDIIEINNKISNLILNKYPKLIDFVEKNKIIYYLRMYRSIALSNTNKEIKKYLKLIRNELKNYNINKYTLNKFDLIEFYIIKYFYVMYTLVMRILTKLKFLKKIKNKK